MNSQSDVFGSSREAPAYEPPHYGPIETERLVLRQLTEEDAADILEFSSDPRTAYWAGMEPMKDLAEAKEAIELGNFFMAEPQYGITVKGSDKVVGTISVSEDLDMSNRLQTILGYLISPDYEGRGYMSEAVKALCVHLFSTTRIPRIMVEIRPDNLPSQGVARKCGFVRNAAQVRRRLNHYGKPLDEYFLERPLNDDTEPKVNS